MAEIEGMGTNTNSDNNGDVVVATDQPVVVNEGGDGAATANVNSHPEAGTSGVQAAINDSGFAAKEFGADAATMANAAPGSTFTAGDETKNATITVNDKPGSFNLETNDNSK